MPLKTPAFWYKRPGLKSFLLTPISWIYQLGHRIFQASKSEPYTSSVPVICIGNAIAGGSGKTPVAIALVKLLQENNVVQNPFFLTRGYGGNIKGPALVDPDTHHFTEVGDEPLLLARHAKTIVSADRAKGAKLAEELGADLIIMDDGLQNNGLAKTISLLVIDRRQDFGNGKTIPAGPLREPLSRILPKVQGVICIGKPLRSELDVFEAIIKPTKIPKKDKSYIAFAGIGWPQKFKYSLEDMDLNLKGWHKFPDHHPYTEEEIQALKQEAQNKKATLITTEKDIIRLSKSMAYDIQTLPIYMSFFDEEKLIAFINNKLAGNI